SADEATKLEPAKFTELAHQKAIAAYDLRESEYPVLAGLYRFSARGSSGERQGLLREDLIEWAKRRFDAEISSDDLKNKQREEIHTLLVEHSQKNNEKAKRVVPEAQQRVEQLYANEPANSAATLGTVTGNNGKLDDLASWLKATCDTEIKNDQLAGLDREEAKRKVSQVVEDHFRPEMRRMERALLLQILDTNWKEHLLAMDHLRSSVGLRGYAQVDPKVEYKREGMLLFDGMWTSVGNYVTDLIFKMAQHAEGFFANTGVESQAIKEDAKPASEIERQQQAAIAGTEADKKIEPIRNLEPKVGRNDPCPCGSGKKYKQCCMRKG